ncbi:MAG: hypothetical protein SGILL_007540 [Bacillariaceae sp.]
MPYSDNIGFKDSGSDDGYDVDSESQTTQQQQQQHSPSKKAEVELTHRKSGLVPFRDEELDDDDDFYDAHSGYTPSASSNNSSSSNNNHKNGSNAARRSWCLKLLPIAVAVIVVAMAVSSHQNQESSKQASVGGGQLDVPLENNGVENSNDDDGVDVISNEHEEEIEEAEEALEEEEETEGPPPPQDANTNNYDSGNPYSLGTEHTWFELHTGNDRIDTAYKLAMAELEANIATTKGNSYDPTDPYFIAGNGWTQLWTRDTSYAIELGAGLVRPDVSLTSLQKCTSMVPLTETNGDGTLSSKKKVVWYQDKCGHFGGWPNLSDAIVGARGAWSLYLYTGNTTFLEWAYDITVNSLKRAEQDVKHHGLFHGCSSFMESNSGYPLKYALNGTLVGNTKALSTNMLYWNGYRLASEMGDILLMNNEEVGHLRNQADKLREKIRDTFWQEDKGFYAYLHDENGNLVEQMEGLGEALVLLSEEFESSEHRVRSILGHTHRTEIGIPCLWPRFDHGDIPNLDDDHHISMRYHNGRIWPFVSGYFAIAAARKGRADIFTEEMIRLIDLSEQNNTFAEFYELDKTFPPKRRRQLWSDTGYMGMIYQGLFGMVFEVNGIIFIPTKSKLSSYGFAEMDETISLLNVKYRKAVLDIHVKGYGNRIKTFSINGETQKLPKVDATAEGKQVIEIEVAEGA